MKCNKYLLNDIGAWMAWKGLHEFPNFQKHYVLHYRHYTQHCAHSREREEWVSECMYPLAIAVIYWIDRTTKCPLWWSLVPWQSFRLIHSPALCVLCGNGPTTTSTRKLLHIWFGHILLCLAGDLSAERENGKDSAREPLPPDRRSSSLASVVVCTEWQIEWVRKRFELTLEPGKAASRRRRGVTTNFIGNKKGVTFNGKK